jgi:hypothetical protein
MGRACTAEYTTTARPPILALSTPQSRPQKCLADSSTPACSLHMAHTLHSEHHSSQWSHEYLTLWSATVTRPGPAHCINAQALHNVDSSSHNENWLHTMAAHTGSTNWLQRHPSPQPWHSQAHPGFARAARAHIDSRRVRKTTPKPGYRHYTCNAPFHTPALPQGSQLPGQSAAVQGGSIHATQLQHWLVAHHLTS